MTKGGSVYIVTNKLKITLYIGVTADLQVRIQQHKEHYFKDSFSDRYNLEYCVYYENFYSIEEAILKEKQVKKWSRIKKENLINSLNPDWADLWKKLRTGNWRLKCELLFTMRHFERHVEERDISKFLYSITM